MVKHSSLFMLMLGLIVSACTSPPTIDVPPLETYSIPITNETGETISSQPGPTWVLLSGVDEHGLVLEPKLNLLTSADILSGVAAEIETGAPAAVLEIRHLGPQGLQRFYLVETTNGESGWISDFYIRRLAYLFNIDGTTVPIHSSPEGPEFIQFTNVTPVTIIDPRDPNWWQIINIDQTLSGWVQVDYVKESSEEEFLLLLQQEHLHDNSP